MVDDRGSVRWASTEVPSGVAHGIHGGEVVEALEHGPRQRLGVVGSPPQEHGPEVDVLGDSPGRGLRRRVSAGRRSFRVDEGRGAATPPSRALHTGRTPPRSPARGPRRRRPWPAWPPARAARCAPAGGAKSPSASTSSGPRRPAALLHTHDVTRRPARPRRRRHRCTPPRPRRRRRPSSARRRGAGRGRVPVRVRAPRLGARRRRRPRSDTGRRGRPIRRRGGRPTRIRQNGIRSNGASRSPPSRHRSPHTLTQLPGGNAAEHQHAPAR